MTRPERPAPVFDARFRAAFHDLLRWRRDVRHFRSDPVASEALARALDAFRLAPSVGLSEPWRLVRVDSAAARATIIANFEQSNAQALSGYSDEKARIYAGLKLAGLREAPVQIAVFCDEATPKGAGLGARTMPQMRAYSVACAITCFWLALRAEDLGLGWVSILDPVRLARDLDVPAGWQLVGYLCIGHPTGEDATPELERVGWEAREAALELLSR